MDAFLGKLEKGKSYDRIYYLATSFTFMPMIAKQLKKYKLHTHKDKFRRVVFEKPFGTDLSTSKKLNTTIQKIFDEESIYRIDHYLGKETVQNILTLRLGNPLFEGVWSSEFIEKINIVAEEDSNVGKRIGYYDNAGAIKDMVQSHLLQVASLVLMDAPEKYDATNIHDEKVKVLKKLRLASTKDLTIGQYRSYGGEVKAAGLKKSATETYVDVKLRCNSRRWKGTDIVLTTGKMLGNRRAYIEIIFKKNPCKHHCKLYKIKTNKLTIDIQPTQDIAFDFNHYVLAADVFKAVTMEFCHSCEFTGNSIAAYDTLLAECIAGDKTLFTRFDELQESWKITDALVSAKKSVALKKYADHGKELS